MITTFLTQNEIIRKVTLFHIPILFCLFILTDHETISMHSNTNELTTERTTTNHQHQRHLAVFTALSRHPPSMRVYRGLFELLILSFCASFSLYVWESIIVDRRILKELIFAIPYTLQQRQEEEEDDDDGTDGTVLSTSRQQHAIIQQHDDDDDDGHNDENDSNNNHYSFTGLELESETMNIMDQEKNHQEKSNHYTSCNQNQQIHQSTITSTFLLNRSLDYLLLFLISLFLFTISSSAGGQYIDLTSTTTKNKSENNNNQSFLLLSHISSIAAPVFPLVLFLFFILHLFFPWNTSRYHLWTCISYTIGAPFYDVTFRDGFIGDIFTSMVRPMQDLAYTTFYLVSGLQGWWAYSYHNHKENPMTTLEEDAILQPVEHSWLLHTVILPACMVSPLWWRYCQTLRQCYDTKKRWPYLGNALKYFLAAQVVILSVFFEPKRQRYFVIWIGLYVIATFYQILWDIFMDWEMFVLSRRTNDGVYHLELRKDRLFSSRSFYIGVLILNIILRFGWILNFIPMEYLSQTTGVLEYTFSADFATFVSPLLAFAEIIRRMMWGLIRFELEALKKMKQPPLFVDASNTKSVTKQHTVSIMDDDCGDGSEMKPMSIATTVNNQTNLLSFKSLSSVTFRNDLNTANDVQTLWELCVYATIFMCTGIIAGIHREVL